MKRLGLIVNPISGMGGAVGLHGTDGAEVLAEARARGATGEAIGRARRALAALAETVPEASVIAAGGPMGGDAAAGLALKVQTLPLPAGGETTARDTVAAAEALVARDVDLILFAGGDGTARDIAAVAGLGVPLLGIPAGVKMQSGVFATSPEAAGRIAGELVAGGRRVGFRKVEVMDLDEDARRRGRIGARLYGYVRAPHVRHLLQAAKSAPLLSDDAALGAACHEVAAALAPDVTWLIGPGTTAKQVLTALGATGTLLGVDAVREGRVVGRDLSERDSLALVAEGAVGIVVGVTGGQGFLFGRGNQQIGASLIRRAWPERLVVLASEGKLAALPEPRLHVDTGDPALDAAMTGFVRVHTGPRRTTLMRLTA